MEKVIRVSGPLAAALMVMLLMSSFISRAGRGTARFVVTSTYRLHRWYLMYPLLALTVAWFVGPWAYTNQVALELALERSEMLAHEVAELKHQIRVSEFRNNQVEQLVDSSPHKRELRPAMARKDAFVEFTSNGGPEWVMSHVVELAIGKMEQKGFSPEQQLVYLAIMAVESGFNPFALNPESTAGGVHQFIHETGSLYQLEPSELLNPEKNLDSGIRHFADNWERLVREDRLTGQGEEFIFNAFKLMYRLHYDGQNHDLSRRTSKGAAEGIKVGMAYLEQAMPIIYSQPPAMVVKEDLREEVFESAKLKVALQQKQLETQLKSTLSELLERSGVLEWFAASRWSTSQ